MALPFLILSSARSHAFATPSGYRAGGAHRPFAAALSLAIAGGIGATLILALVIPEAIDKDVDEPWETIILRDPVPEPVKNPEPQAQQPKTVITATRPPFEVPRFAEAPIGEIADPLPPITVIPTDVGTGGGGVVADPPRAPIFRPATRNSRFTRDFQPPYPSAHERDGVEGRCPVTVTIAASGRVTGVVSNGCNDDLFFAATQRQALNRWRFNPATRDGVAIESTQDVAVSFRIVE